MWLDLAIALSAGAGGLVCGWIMYAMGGFGNTGLVKQAAARINRGDFQQAAQEQIQEVAERLMDDAYSMAADVDAHQTRMQAVNNTLIEDKVSSPDAVVRAVGELMNANEAMQTQLRKAQDRIHEQTAQIESAERRANTDALTRIPNRAAFDAHLQRQYALGPGKAGTLAILDVDHFKQFNDVYGHRAGDEVLQVVARSLHARLQPYGLVARFGGEEFAVFLDGYSVDQAKDLVEMARIAVGERNIEFEDKRLRVAASVGVAELLKGERIEDWLQRADDGLYRSKEQGRDCGHWMDVNTPRRIESNIASHDTDRRIHQHTSAATTKQSPEPKPTLEVRASQTSDEAEIPDVQVGTSMPAQETVQHSKDDVPNRETLQAEFGEIRGRTQSSVPLFVMAIQCTSPPNNGSMRSLLQIVRATLRSVDRIGRDDESTLLVCMPSVDAKTASDRAHQICDSAEAMGLQSKESGQRPISIGIAETHPDEGFYVVVSRAAELARQAQLGDTSCVCLEGQWATG